MIIFYQFYSQQILHKFVENHSFILPIQNLSVYIYMYIAKL